MLTDRLASVASCIFRCKTFADVGCDHGLVSKYVVDNGLAERVVCIDVSAKCLEKAKALIGDKAEYQVSDGLGKIRPDIAVICGMGAQTICDIISRAENKPYFILGAQKNVDKLREFLVGNGYEIVKDFVSYEDGKYYDIICAKDGNQQLDEYQIQEGVFYKTYSKTRKDRLTEKIKKYKTYLMTEENERILKIAEECLKWQN